MNLFSSYRVSGGGCTLFDNLVGGERVKEKISSELVPVPVVALIFCTYRREGRQ